MVILFNFLMNFAALFFDLLSARYSEEQWINWVDRLAAEDYVVIDDFIAQDELQQLRGFLHEKNEEDEFEKAGIGSVFQHTIDKEIRGDFIYWLAKARDTSIDFAFAYAEELMGYLNRYCFLSLSDYEFHLAHYPKGTFYQKHIDQFKGRGNRIISFVLYLNVGWQPGDGGEIRIFKEDSTFDVQPIGARLVLFKSMDVPHEVLKTNVSRYSLTGWLLNKPSQLGYLLG